MTQSYYEVGAELRGELRSSDATEPERMERLLRVFRIAGELDSRRYPPCLWVKQAPSLVSDLAPFALRFSAASRQRIVDAYVEFASQHLSLHAPESLADGIGYVITQSVADLATMPAEQLATVEYTLDRLERVPKIADSVRYLRALYYRQARRSAPWDLRLELSRKAHAALRELADAGHGPYHRKALAMLASDLEADGDHMPALREYANYVKRYPHSPWAQVAALRLAGDSAGVGNFQVMEPSFN